MRVEIDLTDEQVKWAMGKFRACQHDDPASHYGNGCDIAGAIVDALPQPTLRERAYKIVDPPGNLPVWGYDVNACADMARWLYKNAGDSAWYVGSYTGSRFYGCIGDSVANEVVFDNLADAYAHVVVGLGE